MAEYMAERRKNRRSALLSLHGDKCKECGSTESLEFNHRDRESKLFILSGCHLDKSWQKILAESEKCDLLCASCHKDYTAQQWAKGELTVHNKNEAPYAHGTPRMYQEQKCRCDDCKKAKRRYRAKELDYLGNVVE